MKKILALVLSFALILSLTAAASYAESEEANKKALTYGDINQDCTVDIIDVSMLRAHIVETSVLQGKALILADINHDNMTDIIDVVLMRNAIVNGIALEEYIENTPTESDAVTDSETDTVTDVLTDTEIDSETDTDTSTDTATDTSTDTDDGIPVIDGRGELEFEDGTYRGTLSDVYGHNGKSILFESNSHNSTVQFKVSKTGRYTIKAYLISPFGDKVGNIEFAAIGKMTCGIKKSNDPQEFEIFTGTLNAGEVYKVKATPNWTYIFADYVLIETAKDLPIEEDSEVELAPLTNKNATEETKAVYEYLCSVYGKGILTCQQESTWMEDGNAEYEMEYLLSKTGKLPAMRGLDFISDDFDGCVKRAIDWHDRGGIVTICWHTGSDFSKGYNECLKGNISDWNAALTPGTAEYDKLVAGMDKGAKALKRLQDAGVPVLWRPFHEFDGKWFWWGKGGEENFIKLWRLMYDRYTNYWGLNNLIWVLGYSQNGVGYESWYPGDDYVDIAGADSYNGGVQAGLYNTVKDIVNDKKMVCFHECGENPTAEMLIDQRAKWIYFMTWHTSWLTDNNPDSALKALYNSDYAITLDELPNLYDYAVVD